MLPLAFKDCPCIFLKLDEISDRGVESGNSKLNIKTLYILQTGLVFLIKLYYKFIDNQLGQQSQIQHQKADQQVDG